MGVGDEDEMSMGDAGREVILKFCFQDFDRVLLLFPVLMAIW